MQKVLSCPLETLGGDFTFIQGSKIGLPLWVFAQLLRQWVKGPIPPGIWGLSEVSQLR